MIQIAEVERRIRLIIRYGQRLEEMARLPADQFAADELRVAATERYLQIATEMCIEISLLLISGLRLRQPESYERISETLIGAGFGPADSAPQIDNIIKMRNLLLHGYTGLDPVILHQQLSPRLVELQLFAKQALTFVRKHE